MADITKLNLRENVPFSELGSYRLGGVVRYFAMPTSEEEVRELVSIIKEKNWPIFILGGGTNILMNDAGFEGLMIQPHFSFIEQEGSSIRVGAGVLVSDLLSYAMEHNLGGMEWAGGLPGTVGGAVRGNAGCFGSETKDIVQQVESIDIFTGEKIVRDNKDCDFSYRSSIFKKEREGKEVITAVTLKLFEQDGEVSKKVSDSHIQYRKDRQPLEYPNIGSIFKNVDARGMSEEEKVQFSAVMKQDPFLVIPAAYLISEVGVKGVSRGGAVISEKHPNFIVNMGNAKASDVEELIMYIKEKVKEKFNIDLEPEVIRI